MRSNKISHFVFLLLWIFIFSQILFNSTLRDALFDFCDSNPLQAPLVLVLGQILFATFILPCSSFSVLAGILWGWELGLLYSMFATASASIWTYWISRRIPNRWISGALSKPVWQRISNQIEEYGWRASAIAHANPILPGSSLGYLFGLSKLPFSAFLTGVIAGSLPLQVLTVLLGNTFHQETMIVSGGTVLAFLGLVLSILVYRLVAPKVLSKTNEDEL